MKILPILTVVAILAFAVTLLVSILRGHDIRASLKIPFIQFFIETRSPAPQAKAVAAAEEPGNRNPAEGK
jgi:hypothetical protein